MGDSLAAVENRGFSRACAGDVRWRGPETGTKATRGHFLNSFGEAVIIAELDQAAVAAERVAQLTEG
jgi:hypothetical protein